jgi:GNAT superfamily N-acetyltransferase
MLQIRNAKVEDVPLLHRMILEFADFERFREYVTITEEILARDGFGENPRFHTLISEWDGKTAGYAIYYVFYSSFEGPGLFVEDIFVREAYRGKGIGKALMAEIAAIAGREGYSVLRWEVLDWNRPAIEFYERLGAEFPKEWKPVRFEGDALKRLASSAGLTSKLTD